ncbi:GPP34 family phosphoprotein [Streptomyces sp. NPDC051561]|uniref:GOLPH3/VPS74 family protein n=1 Tax=Streptomyces sp. NPDC051561 TaxID=3365658 RepID=UPI003796D1E7
MSEVPRRSSLPWVLLLPEELLLLGLHPERGGARINTRYLEYGVAGTVLAVLERAGCVEQGERGRVQVRNPIPPPALLSGPDADPVAVRVLEGLPGPGKGRHGGIRITSYLRQARREVMGQYLDLMVERGILRRESKRVLGLFPVVRHPVADGAHWTAALRERVLVAAEHGFPGEEDRLLAGFVYATGLLRKVYPGPEGRGVKRVLKEVAREEWFARAVEKIIASDEAAASGGGG